MRLINVYKNIYKTLIFQNHLYKQVYQNLDYISLNYSKNSRIHNIPPYKNAKLIILKYINLFKIFNYKFFSKIMNVLQNDTEVSIELPTIIRGMKTLDKSLFKQKIIVKTLKIPGSFISNIMRVLKKKSFKASNINNISTII